VRERRERRGGEGGGEGGGGGGGGGGEGEGGGRGGGGERDIHQHHSLLFSLFQSLLYLLLLHIESNFQLSNILHLQSLIKINLIKLLIEKTLK
jgi:hypothetical protein